MLKKLWGSLLLLLLLFAFALPADAAQPAQTEIEVTIDGGGTAIIIPQVNCPVPDHTTVTVADGETGRFTIQFNQPGDYSYTIKVQEKADEAAYAPLSYTAVIAVFTADDGSLYAVTVMNSEVTDKKADVAAFSNDLPPSTVVPPDTTTTQPAKPHQPQTGDESHLDNYLLLAIAAAAGLFALSLIYTHFTNKLIRKDK